MPCKTALKHHHCGHEVNIRNDMAFRQQGKEEKARKEADKRTS
jgi:hypothetical protein